MPNLTSIKSRQLVRPFLPLGNGEGMSTALSRQQIVNDGLSCSSSAFVFYGVLASINTWLITLTPLGRKWPSNS